MNFRTTFNIAPADVKIDHAMPVIFIGSCFASEIGNKMAEGKMNVVINPSGTIYNPCSVGNTIELIIENRTFTAEDLYIYNGLNISFSHYTDFSSRDAGSALEKINTATDKAHHFLKKAGYLFVTFGTARIYRFKENNQVVSNCHKLPQSLFAEELLSVEAVTSYWNEILQKLSVFNRELKVIFTVSPVRHWKDGAHGNQVSKSVLFLSVENLLKDRTVHSYFPAYELLMDDLRDYRYYADDMIHPSRVAIEYIWQAFSECYFEKDTINLWKEIQNITMSVNHRFITDSADGRKKFADTVLKKILLIEKREPSVDLSKEKSHFLNLIS